MFSQACVCLSIGWIGNIKCVMDRSYARVPSPRTSDLGPPLLMTSGGNHWRPVQTFKFGDLPPPPSQNGI